jgi:hypothetical protein
LRARIPATHCNVAVWLLRRTNWESFMTIAWPSDHRKCKDVDVYCEFIIIFVTSLKNACKENPRRTFTVRGLCTSRSSRAKPFAFI